MPRVKPNRFTRWLGRSVLRLGGWHVSGPIPDIPKAVVIAAPHSSNWDGIWGFAAKLALGLEVRVLGKHQLFWWPLGPLLRRLGGIPINRAQPRGMIEQAVDMIRRADRMWFVIAPEGTRKPVEKWKTGFLKIARAAEVPVMAAYFHYPERTIGIGHLFHLGDDLDADMARVREWYRPWIGRNRGTI
ncbi:lysophospholipid acyltransferase family protein [Lysobacter spongiae]|uniref:Lysophospholipid acyltransferase family protein n=2 Tax=Marilutibacter spongiae TaxID=2025720 RepID=A0A7W3TNU5_9GAMM|nr:lysophospholipid acyltransferase family protein [Lysobacter spongiae]